MRSDRPDHRHRCFAEKRPAPRAIAHQEAFCLSPAFPSCPTFQDWARREAAQARTSTGAAAADAGPVASGMASGAGLPTNGRPEPTPAPDGDADAGSTDDRSQAPADLGLMTDDEPGGPGDADEDAAGYEPPEPGWLPDIPETPDIPAARNASRSWAAPPPWAGAGGSVGPSASPPRRSGSDPIDPDAPPPAGLASSRWLADVKPGDELDAEDPDVATPQRSRDPVSWQAPGASASGTPSFLAGRAAPSDVPDASPDGELAALVSRNRPAGGPARRNPRPMAGQQRQARRQQPPPRDEVGPSWERPRRFEAYPTLKTRVGLPGVPRVALGLLALLVAAILVFMIPALFFGKPNAGASPTPSTSIAPSVSLVPTATAAPTPTTYTVVKGDNLLKIAKKYGVTQAQILTANPQIKDPNKIKVGDVIVIPLAIPSEIIDSTSPSPAESASSAP